MNVSRETPSAPGRFRTSALVPLREGQVHIIVTMPHGSRIEYYETTGLHWWRDTPTVFGELVELYEFPEWAGVLPW